MTDFFPKMYSIIPSSVLPRIELGIFYMMIMWLVPDCSLISAGLSNILNQLSCRLVAYEVLYLASFSWLFVVVAVNGLKYCVNPIYSNSLWFR